MLQNAIRNLKNQEGEGEGGFTLIELLVVILIIGILAAIALPTFLGQSDKAKDSKAESNARNALTQMKSCLTSGDSATDTTACASSSDVTQFKKTVVTSTGAGIFKVVATSDGKTGAAENTFTISSTAGSPGGYTYTCTGTDSCGSNWTDGSTIIPQ